MTNNNHPQRVTDGMARVVRRGLRYAAPAALLLAVAPIGTAQADDHFDALRAAMKAGTSVQPTTVTSVDLGRLRDGITAHTPVRATSITSVDAGRLRDDITAHTPVRPTTATYADIEELRALMKAQPSQPTAAPRAASTTSLDSLVIAAHAASVHVQLDELFGR